MNVGFKSITLQLGAAPAKVMPGFPFAGAGKRVLRPKAAAFVRKQSSIFQT